MTVGDDVYRWAHDRRRSKQGRVRRGQVQEAGPYSIENPRQAALFPAQSAWRSPPSLEDVELEAVRQPFRRWGRQRHYRFYFTGEVLQQKQQMQSSGALGLINQRP